MAKNKYSNSTEKKLIWAYYEKNISGLQICKILNVYRDKT